MPGNKEFGERIRQLREAKKATDPSFSLRQFANKVGISATFLSKVETGQFAPPAAKTIKKMAPLLETDTDELLALAKKKDPDLDNIIIEQPKAMADFLRTAREKGLTAEDIQKITEKIRQGKKP